MNVEYGKLKMVLIATIGILSPIVAAGAKWSFLPDWFLLLCMCLSTGCSTLLAYTLKPPTSSEELSKLLNFSRQDLGSDEALIPPPDTEAKKNC